MSEPTTICCPICRSHDLADYHLLGIGSHPPAGVERYQVLRCRAHGVEFADAIPPASTDADAVAALDIMYGGDVGDRYRVLMDQVERVRAGPGILHDVGCAHGHLLDEAARRGWTAQGNDLTLPPSASIHPRHRGALPSLNLTDASVDVVTQICVLPHLANPRPELEAAFGLLKRGGWLFAQLPDRGLYRRAAHGLYRLSGGRWRTILAEAHSPGGHTVAYDRQNVVALLEAVGFVECRAWPFSIPACWSLSRYRPAPARTRLMAAVAVHSLSLAARLSGQTNHMLAVGRRP